MSLVILPSDAEIYNELSRSCLLLGCMMGVLGALGVIVSLVRRLGRIAVGAAPAGLPTPLPPSPGLTRLRPVHVVDAAEGGWWWHPTDRSDARRFTYVLAMVHLPLIIACVMVLRPWGPFAGDVVVAGVLIVLVCGGMLIRLPGQAKRDAAQPRLRMNGQALTLVQANGATEIGRDAVLCLRLRAAPSPISGLKALALDLVWRDGDATRSAPVAATILGCGTLAGRAATMANHLGVPLIVA
jgi:hypothetical protein